MTLRRRLVPYFLLGPGAIWLVLFFVVPMYFMAELALRSGSIATGGFTFTWEWANFPDALRATRSRSVRSVYYSDRRDVHRAADRLPARLRDRAGVKALAPDPAVRGDGAVLHHLPDPHDRLEDDPLRRQPDRQRPADPPGHSRRRAPARDIRRGDRGAHLQLPAVHDPADLREPRAARPAPGRGGEGPLRLLAAGLPQGDAAADGARHRRRRAAHLHSRRSATTSTRRCSAARASR